jgi:transposase-like protein
MKEVLPSGAAVVAQDAAAQGARRATGAVASCAAPPPDPEVVVTAKRRKFAGTEKRRILQAADRCTQPGELGALMRREGIYSSMLRNWRKQRERGETAVLEARRRGPKPDLDRAAQRKVQAMQLEIDRLERRLAQAHEIIDDRGRDARYRAPPAQIRTGPIRAYGSYLGCVTAKRWSGHG